MALLQYFKSADQYGPEVRSAAINLSVAR